MSFDESLVRHVFYPLHERLRGRHTLRAMREFGRYVTDPPHAAAEFELRLRRVLNLADRQCPFFHERFQAAGLALDGPDLAAQLRRLPLLTKADIRANAERLVWRGVPGGLQPAITSGSMGDPLRFYLDRGRAAETMGARLWLQQQFGVRPGDRRVYLWGSPIEAGVGWVKRWRNRLLNEIVLSAFEMDAATIDRYLARIRRYRPRLIYGFSGAIGLLAQHAARRHGPGDFTFLRAVVATGEPVTDDQRAQVRLTFGCPLISEYGARESGLIAHECPHGTLHVLTRNVHVEVLRDGQPAPPGVSGEIVCTSLSNHGQPFIRYKQGDIGAISETACACGWRLPTLRLDTARVNGFLALPDGRLCTGVISAYICRDRPGVVGYRVHQRTLHDFDIWIEPGAGYTPATLDQIRDRCLRLFGPQTRINFRVVERIPPLPSGKHCGSLSDVAGDYTRFEVVTPEALTASIE